MRVADIHREASLGTVEATSAAAAIACGDTTASLTGATFAAQLFTGTDAVRTVGCH